MMRAANRLMILGLTSALALSACNGSNAKPQSASAKSPPKPFDRDPFPSTYRAYPGVPTVVTNVTIYDGEGGRITGGQVLFADGKIVGTKRLFADGTVPAALKLQTSRTFDTGVVRQSYRFEGGLDYGYFGLEQPSAEELERQRRIAAALD